MKKYIYFLMFLSVCLCWQSCKKGKTSGYPALPLEKFSDGDLAFRRGVGLTSHIVLSASNGDGIYSHVGILKIVDGEWCVIHAVPDEPEFEGDADRVKIEPIRKFFAPDRAVRGAVMRLSGDTLVPLRAASAALQVANRGTLFDHEYDLSDTTEMYCTELVEYAYTKAGTSLSEGRISRLDVPVFGGIYLLPADLASNARLKVIYQFAR